MVGSKRHLHGHLSVSLPPRPGQISVKRNMAVNMAIRGETESETKRKARQKRLSEIHDSKYTQLRHYPVKHVLVK